MANSTISTLKVGDNVGDCAARGADLFESIAAEIISAMILGGTMAQRCKIEGENSAVNGLHLSICCSHQNLYFWTSVLADWLHICFLELIVRLMHVLHT